MHGKGHFVFINVTTESKRHGLKAFAVKQNKITTLEQLPKGMPVRFRYQPARRTKCYFVEFGWNHENRYSSLVKGRDFYFYR